MNASEKPRRMKWKPIEPLASNDIPRNGTFSALDALRTEWETRMSSLDEAERIAIRQRSIRRLAIETGILERLYDMEWGLTLTLVAEGFTRDVVERSGGKVNDRTIATLEAQRDSIEMVLDFVRSNRTLSPAFIKELHVAITRTQDTYTVTDNLGRVTETELPKGTWKTQPNHVTRKDGTILEYTPPEHVSSEIDRLVEFWKDVGRRGVHPIVMAAWLHHRFVRIHPFADGNGRVARALTVLVLEQHHFPPLVIDRWHRDDYLDALDIANDGDLRPLIKLFTRLETASLVNELEQPDASQDIRLPHEVAHTLADQIKALRQRKEATLQQQLRPRAIAVNGWMTRWFKDQCQSMKEVFREKGINDAVVIDDCASSDSEIEKSEWYRRQIIYSSRIAGHYADFGGYLAWCVIGVRVEGVEIRFLASLHGAGREPGVMAVTTFGRLQETAEGSDESEAKGKGVETFSTTNDAFIFVHSEKTGELESRVSELEELLDHGLSVALAKLMTQI